MKPYSLITFCVCTAFSLTSPVLQAHAQAPGVDSPPRGLHTGPPSFAAGKAPAYWNCSGDAAFGQPPVTDSSGGVTLTTSSEGTGLQAFEYYSGLSFIPQYVTWWGVSGEFNGTYLEPCTRAPSSFRIRFYADDAGQPGTLLKTQLSTVAGTDTGVSYDGFTLYWYRTAVLLPVEQPAGWISVEGMVDTDCWFLWAPSDAGDGAALLWDGVSYDAWDTDLALCLEQESLECPAGTEVSQAPHGPLDPYGIGLSDEAALTMCYETFAGVTEPIVAVRVWGLMHDMAFTPCLREPPEYVISFNALGEVPGVVQRAETAWSPQSPVYMSYGDHGLYQWDIPLSMPLMLDSGYLGVYGYGADADCWFSWLSSGEGDGNAKIKVLEELSEGVFFTRWTNTDNDFAYCLVTDPEACVRPTHSADQDADNAIALSELLRIIQFYNSGGYQVSPIPAETEDGYMPGSGARQSTCPHCSDYAPADWAINLSELLRLIQFYNSDGYHPCAEGEDGYCPGAAR